MNTDQIAAEAAEQWFELYATIGDKFKANSQLASIIKAAIEKAQSADTKRLDYIATGLYEIRKSKHGWAILKGFTNYEYDLYPTIREAIDAAMKK